MENLVITLSNGQEVELSEFWACDNDVFDGSDSGTYVEVIDTENNDVLATIKAEIPDEGDYDDADEYQEALDKFIELIEEEI